MQANIDNLTAAVKSCYERERAVIAEINAIGESGADAVRPSPIADKINALETERRESVGRRRKMQLGLQQLRGQLAALLRINKKDGAEAVKGMIDNAISALGDG